VQVDFPEILVGIAEIAVALAGFTGVVVALGSRSRGSWHPGDWLRLYFLLESSLTAGGFALLTLLFLSAFRAPADAWTTASILWALFMSWSLYSSHRGIQDNLRSHDDIDRVANKAVFVLFGVLIVVQIANVLWWREPSPVLAALCSNLAGAAMQFARLIRSAFRA